MVIISDFPAHIGSNLTTLKQSGRHKKGSSGNEFDTGSTSSAVGSSVSKSSGISTHRALSKQIDKTRNYIFTCKSCGFSTDISHSFVDHYFVTHKEIVFVCEIENCGCFYFSQNGLRLHCKPRHFAELCCSTCGTVCLSPAAYTVHMEKNNSKSSIMCEACSKTFTHVNDKVKHFNYRCPRNPNRFIKCKNCNIDIRGAEEGLATHLHEVHDETGIFICLFCHRLFATKKKLDHHNETCTKKNPQIAT